MGFEIFDVTRGAFSTNGEPWLAVIYKENDEFKEGICYQSRLYPLSQINQTFNFGNENSFFFETSNAGKVQTIDIGNDYTDQLIVSGYDSNGSYNLKIYDVSLNPITNTPEVNRGKLKVYPNPTHDVLNVFQGDYSKGGFLEIKIYSDLGKLVYNQRVNNINYKALDVSFLSNGVYTVQISSGGEVMNKKFIKN